MENKEIFATRLKKIRERLGITQLSFAKMVNSTAATISAYENATKNPSLENVINIAKKCEVSIDWLCGLSDNEHIDNESVWSYADIIKFCYSNAEHIKNPAKAIGEITLSFMQTMEKFSKESEHMEQLKRDGLIDQELYDLWVEKTLEKYQTPIVLKSESKTVDAFTGDVFITRHYPGGGESSYEIKHNQKESSPDTPPQE